MPRRKYIDKTTATTYALVHRAQNDPLINDENAPSMVFAEKASTQQPRRLREEDYAYSSAGSVISTSSASVSGRSNYSSNTGKRTRERGDLEEEFGQSVRGNEGEAAEQGVFFDDSGYDYMQHLRDLGTGEGTATWVDASSDSTRQRQSGKGKGKEKLEDALRGLALEGREQEGKDFDDDTRSATTSTSASSTHSLFPEEMFGSEFVRKRTYQDQQDIPDAIAGFQPDMDPALREVLEALDDEAYVMDEDEEFFAELTGDGFEVEKEDWEEERRWDELDDDEGWESEDTVRGISPPPPPPLALELERSEDGTVAEAKPPEDTQAQPPADPTNGAWIDEFQKFKSAAKNSTNPVNPEAVAVAAPQSTLESSALSSLATGRKKKRKGARTSTTNYSMTSSALARTAQQSLLDERFDRLEAAYEEDEFPGDEDESLNDVDDMSMASGFSKASQVSKASKYSNISGVSSYSRASNDPGAPLTQRKDFDGIMDEFLGGFSSAKAGGKRGRRGRGDGGRGMQQLDEIRTGLGPARVKSKAVGMVALS